MGPIIGDATKILRWPRWPLDWSKGKIGVSYRKKCVDSKNVSKIAISWEV